MAVSHTSKARHQDLRTPPELLTSSRERAPGQNEPDRGLLILVGPGLAVRHRCQEIGRVVGCILTAHIPELMSAKKMFPFHGITPHAAAAFGI